jgi:hypothetical protein
MKSVLEEAIVQVVVASSAVDIEILGRFTAVFLSDCSTVPLPTELQDIWQGVGGSEGASKAALRIDTRLELKTGQFHFGLLPDCNSDSRSPVAEAVYERDSLRLHDLGYFNLGRMKEQDVRCEYWISRLQPRTQVFTMTGGLIHLLVHLQTLLK